MLDLVLGFDVMEQVLNDLWGGVKDSYMPNGKKCGISEETYELSIMVEISEFMSKNS